MYAKQFFFSLLLVFSVACNSESTPAKSAGKSNSENSDPVAVLFETNLGSFTVTLNTEKAPITAANFLQYVDDGFYEGTIFHRVINGFMVQGGGFTKDMQQKDTHPPIQNEADNGLPNVVGSIAMARTGIPHSATSQFFINVNDNTFLNHTAKNPAGWGYAVFGQVTEGMETINAIKEAATGNRGQFQNVPIDTIVIERASRSPN